MSEVPLKLRAPEFFAVLNTLFLRFGLALGAIPYFYRFKIPNFLPGLFQLNNLQNGIH